MVTHDQRSFETMNRHFKAISMSFKDHRYISSMYAYVLSAICVADDLYHFLVCLTRCCIQIHDQISFEVITGHFKSFQDHQGHTYETYI